MEKGKAAARAEELKVQVEEAAGKAAAEEARRGEQQAAHEASLVELQNAEKASVQQAVTRLLQLNYFSKVAPRPCTRPGASVGGVFELKSLSLVGVEETGGVGGSNVLRVYKLHF